MLFLSRSPRSLRPGGLVLSALKGARDQRAGWLAQRRTIPPAANRPPAGKGELRHSGACSWHYRTGAGRTMRVWMGARQTCRGIRFPRARTGSVRSAARTQARRRPNLRARLQLTSSWSPRSRDSRFLPMAMVGVGPCQRIKIFVVTVYIEAGFLASGLQVFRIVKRRDGWQCGGKGWDFFDDWDLVERVVRRANAGCH